MLSDRQDGFGTANVDDNVSPFESSPDAGDQFGVVALSGDTLAVGAVGEGSSTVLDQDDNTIPDAGAVYVFQ